VHFRRCIVAVVVACLFQSGLEAQTRPLELRWNELAPIVLGQTVELTVPGATVKGEIVAVRDDSLVMDVQKTSNATSIPKGSASIPKSSVTLLKVRRNRGNWGRNLGVTVGVLSGVVIGGYTAGTNTNKASTGIPLFLSIASGISIGGYFLGKQLDRKTTLIRVVPG
jgi:hypothetical protein